MPSSIATEAGAEERLAGVPALVGFALVLVGLLALVLPTGSEYAELAATAGSDAYSLAYLEVLTRANPRDVDLRLVYARQLGVQGRYDDALATLAPAVGDTRLGARARDLRLELRLSRARGFAEGDARRDAAFADVREDMTAIAGRQLPRERAEQLAKLALELGETRLAADLYERVAKAETGAERAELLARAGQWLRATGNSRAAAEAYQAAATASESSPASSLSYATLAVASLESDNRVPDAADLAEKVAAKHWGDPNAVALASRLAMACGRPGPARTFGRRLLELSPQDETLMRDQVSRELGVGDRSAALALLNKLVAMHPDDFDLRVLRARVAEWASDLETTQRDLEWLVAHPRARVKP